MRTRLAGGELLARICGTSSNPTKGRLGDRRNAEGAATTSEDSLVLEFGLRKATRHPMWMYPN